MVVDGIVSNEKLAELLALQAEYPELDYKRTLDVTTTEDAVELAKDIGAMQVRGTKRRTKGDGSSRDRSAR